MATMHGGRERGAVAVVTAVAILALLLIAAAAIDIGKAIYVRGNLQMAVDGAMKAAAAAAVTQPSGMTDAQIEAAAKTTVKAFVTSNALSGTSGLVNYNLDNDADFQVTYIPADVSNLSSNENSLVVTLKARVPVSLGKLFFSQIPVTISGRVKRPRPAPVQMVIALDTTSSMNQNLDPDPVTGVVQTKIKALKSSAKALVETLMAGTTVKIGLVPFSTYIRLDPNAGYFNHSTLISQVDWLGFTAEPVINDCYAWRDTNCRWAPGGTCYNDGVPYDCQQYVCDSRVCTDLRRRVNYWNGCVYFRPPPERTTISNASRKYYGIWSWPTCAYASMITDLATKGQNYTIGNTSYSAKDFIKAKIDALTVNAYGLTYIPAGLIWAWNMLTAETGTAFPLNSGYTATQLNELGVRRALVLITDGNNSGFAYTAYNTGGVSYDGLGTIQNRAYTPAQQATYRDQTVADMVTICGKIRDADIELFVIALAVNSVADAGYKAMLRDQCASNRGDGYFFDVNNSADLQAAFTRIGAAFSYNSLKE